MANCEESAVTKRRAEFISKMQLAVTEIQNKFNEFHSELFGKEAKLIRIVQKIQKDTLEKFDEMTPRLNEIEKGRESLISILTSNSNQKLLDMNLHSFSSEIDEIIGKSRIDRIIELKWKNGGISIDNICRIKVNFSVDSSTQEILHKESSENSKNEYSSQNTYQKFQRGRANRCFREYSPYHRVKRPNVIRNPRNSQSNSTPRNTSFPIHSHANTNAPESSIVSMETHESNSLV